MNISFVGTAAEALSFLKAIRAMAHECGGAFEVSSGTILATERQIYDCLNEFVSDGNAHTSVELKITFVADGAKFACCSRALIPGGTGCLWPAGKEE